MTFVNVKNPSRFSSVSAPLGLRLLPVSELFAIFADGSERVGSRPPERAGTPALTLQKSIDMAKGNMLLGFSRGSVGDLTFYRRNAQQVTRARARMVKNPKTLAQQMQRAIMRTSVEAYKVLKEVCDHSWEGVAYGANSYAEFQKMNMAMLRRIASVDGLAAQSYLPAGFNGLVAMPWVVSKGSIAWAGGYSFNAGAGGHGMACNFLNTLPAASTIQSVTYDQMAGFFGCQVGDQLTFVWCPKRTDIDESSANKINVARVILAPSIGDAAETQMFSAAGKVINGNPLNENARALTFNVDDQHLEITFDDADDYIGGVIIVSRKAADGSWLRSAETFKYSANQRDGGYTLRQASMVASTEIAATSDWYLNNANEGSGK